MNGVIRISRCLPTRIVPIKGRFYGAAAVLRSSGFTSEIVGTLKEEGPVVGSFATCHHIFTQETTNEFAAICGDNNPLHTKPEIAENSMFKGTIVHGILVSSLFSTLFGRVLHGAIYVSQTLQFKRPVHVGSQVRAEMKILRIDKKRSGHVLICSTNAYTTSKFTNDKEVLVITGEAECLLPFSEYPDVQATA